MKCTKFITLTLLISSIFSVHADDQTDDITLSMEQILDIGTEVNLELERQRANKPKMSSTHPLAQEIKGHIDYFFSINDKLTQSKWERVYLYVTDPTLHNADILQYVIEDFVEWRDDAIAKGWVRGSQTLPKVVDYLDARMEEDANAYWKLFERILSWAMAGILETQYQPTQIGSFSHHFEASVGLGTVQTDQDTPIEVEVALQETGVGVDLDAVKKLNYIAVMLVINSSSRTLQGWDDYAASVYLKYENFNSQGKAIAKFRLPSEELGNHSLSVSIYGIENKNEYVSGKPQSIGLVDWIEEFYNEIYLQQSQETGNFEIHTDRERFKKEGTPILSSQESSVEDQGTEVQGTDESEQKTASVLKEAYELVDQAKNERQHGAAHVEKWHRIEKGLNGEPGGMPLSEVRAFKKGAAGKSWEWRWILIEKAYLELGIQEAEIQVSDDQGSEDQGTEVQVSQDQVAENQGTEQSEQMTDSVLKEAHELVDQAKNELQHGAVHVEKWRRIEKGLNGEPGGMPLSEVRAFKIGAAGKSWEWRWILIEKAYLELGIQEVEVVNHENIQKIHLQIVQIYKDNNTILSSEQIDEVKKLQTEVEQIWTMIDEATEYKTREDVQNFLNQAFIKDREKEDTLYLQIIAIYDKMHWEGRKKLTIEEQALVDKLNIERDLIAINIKIQKKDVWDKYEARQKAWEEKEKVRLFKEKIAQGPNICGHLDLDFGTPRYRHRLDQYLPYNWPEERNVKISSDVDIYDSRLVVGSNSRIKNLGSYGQRGTFIIRGVIHENSSVVLCPKNQEDFKFEYDWEAKPDGLYFQIGSTPHPMPNPITKCSRARDGCYPSKRDKLEDDEGCWCWKTVKIDERNTIVISYDKKNDGTSCCQDL